MARTDTLGHFLTDVAGAIKNKKGIQTPIQASSFDTEITNLPSGGGDIVNGIIEQYKANDGTINANTFVEFVKEWASTDEQISNNAYITNTYDGYDIVKLTDTTAFIAYTYENATNSLGGMVVTVDFDTTVTKGTPVQLNSSSRSGSYISIIKLSSTKLVVLHRANNSDALGAVVVTISGTTISASTPVTLISDSSSANGINGVAISDSAFMIIYRNNSYVPVRVFTVSGNNITLAASNDITTLGFGAWGNAKLAKVTSNSAMLVCMYDNYQSVLTGVVCVFDGSSTITLGTPTTLTSTNEKMGSMSAQQLTTNKVVIANAQGGKLHTLICDINGTVITPGTYYTMDSAISDIRSAVSCSVVNSSMFYVTYYNTDSQLMCGRFIVMGNSIVKSTTSRLLEVSNNYGAKIAALTDSIVCTIHEISGLGYVMGATPSSFFTRIKESEKSIDGVTKEQITTSAVGDVTILDTSTKDIFLSRRNVSWGWDLELSLTAVANVVADKWTVYINSIEVLRDEEEAYMHVEETDMLTIVDSNYDTLFTTPFTVDLDTGYTSQFIEFPTAQRPSFEIQDVGFNYENSWQGQIEMGDYVWDCRTKSTSVVLPAQGVDDSGVEVVNGMVGKYRANTGIICANSFVDFNNGSFGSNQTLVSTSSSGLNPKCVLLDTNKVFIVYTNGASASSGMRAIVGTISGTSVSVGTAVTFPLFGQTTDPSRFSLVKLDSSRVMVVYSSYSNTTPAYALTGLICTVSGSTITVGTSTTLINEEYSGLFNTAVALDANRVFIAHCHNTTTSDNSGTLNGLVCGVSGTTITPGTDFALSTSSYTGSSRHLTSIVTDTNKVLVLHSNGATDSVLNGTLCKIVNDTTINVLQSDVILATGTSSAYTQTSNSISAVLLEPNKLFIISRYSSSSYAAMRLVYTTNDMLSYTSESYTTSALSATLGHCAVLVRPDTVAYFYNSSSSNVNIYMGCYKITGNLITRISTLSINSTSGTGKTMYAVGIEGQRVLLLHGSSSSQPKLDSYVVNSEQTCIPATSTIKGLATEEISTTHYGNVWTLNS